MAAVLAAPETEILEAAREAVHTAVEQQTISIALVAGGRAVSFAVRRSEDTSSFAKTPSPVGGHMGRCGRDSLTLWKISHWHEMQRKQQPQQQTLSKSKSRNGDKSM